MLLKGGRSPGLNLGDHEALLPPRYEGALGKHERHSPSQAVDDRTWVSICGPSPGQKEEQLCGFLEKM